MYDPRGISLTSTPFRVNSHADYDRAAEDCEIVVNLTTPEMHAALRGILSYDRRPHGARGRALTRDVLELSLRAGDRLDPAPSLLDVADFDAIAVFPVRNTFWRPARDTLVTHRCPLWNSSTGLTSTCISVDLLHTVYLGPCQTWGGVAIWALLKSGVWGAAESTEAEQVKMALAFMRAELFAFYRRNQDVTRVARLTPKMIGAADHARLKTKGAETYGILLVLSCTRTRYRATLSCMRRGSFWVVFSRGSKIARCGLTCLRLRPAWMTGSDS